MPWPGLPSDFADAETATADSHHGAPQRKRHRTMPPAPLRSPLEAGGPGARRHGSNSSWQRDASPTLSQSTLAMDQLLLDWSRDTDGTDEHGPRAPCVPVAHRAAGRVGSPGPRDPDRGPERLTPLVELLVDLRSRARASGDFHQADVDPGRAGRAPASSSATRPTAPAGRRVRAHDAPRPTVSVSRSPGRRQRAADRRAALDRWSRGSPTRSAAAPS